MDKRQVLKDSITKLLQLNISDREIIDNLKAVGIEEQLAKDMLLETKAELKGKRQPAPQPPKAPEQKSLAQKQAPQQSTLTQATQQVQKQQPAAQPQQRREEAKKEEEPAIPDDEDIYSDAYREEELPRTPVKEKQVSNPSYSKTPDDSISEAWEKGILATIDSKLGEMQRIKSDLDAFLEQKIAEKVKLETRKTETVLESQRALYIGKIDAHLEAKSNEILKVVDAKARHMEDLHSTVQAELQKTQGEKRFNSELLESISEKLAALDTTKSQMISETNSAIMAMESKFDEFMHESEKRRDDDEDKLNRALQLHEKITEGTLEDLRQKIASMRLEKEQELAAKVQAKLQELDELTAQVDPKGITERLASLRELEQQLNRKQKELDSQVLDKKREYRDYIDAYFQEMKREMESFRKEVQKGQVDNLTALRKQYSESVDELFAQNLVEWDKKLKEKKKEIDDLKKQVDIEKFNASMEALDLFKQQFLNTVKRSIEDYNKSKKELAESMLAKDKATGEYLKKIDAKMQELTEFQKRFSKDVAELLNKIPEEEGEKKKQKKE